MQIATLAIIVTALIAKFQILFITNKPGRVLRLLLGYATQGGSKMLLQGLTLTIVGMSVVFTFLTILVFIMKLMAAFIPKYFPDDNTNKQAKIKQTRKESIKNQETPLQNANEALPIADKAIPIADKAIPMGEAEIAAVIAAVKSYSKI